MKTKDEIHHVLEIGSYDVIAGMWERLRGCNSERHLDADLVEGLSVDVVGLRHGVDPGKRLVDVVVSANVSSTIPLGARPRNDD